LTALGRFDTFSAVLQRFNTLNSREDTKSFLLRAFSDPIAEMGVDGVNSPADLPFKADGIGILMLQESRKALFLIRGKYERPMLEAGMRHIQVAVEQKTFSFSISFKLLFRHFSF